MLVDNFKNHDGCLVRELKFSTLIFFVDFSVGGRSSLNLAYPCWSYRMD